MNEESPTPDQGVGLGSGNTNIICIGSTHRAASRFHHPDRPLSFHWRTDEEAIAGLGLPRARSARQAAARNAIITEACIAALFGQWVSYSRSKAFWDPALQRYHGTAYTYDNVVRTVDELAALGLLDHDKAQPRAHLTTGRQSRLRASGSLMAALGGIRAVHQFLAPVRLKNWRNGHSRQHAREKQVLVPLPNTRLVDRLTGQMERINAGRDEIVVSLDGCGGEWLGPCYVLEDSYVLVKSMRVYRLFNRGSFDCYGRLHGWWQNMPKTGRSLILINGEPVAEPDFPQLHPHLIYHRRGKILRCDAYDVDGFERKACKIAFNAAVNARTPQQAKEAIRRALNLPSYAEAGRLYDAMVQRHADVADAFGSDEGIHLMRTDSEIAVGVLQQCQRRDIPVLPVHDSFIVPQRDRDTVRAIMETSYRDQTDGGIISV